MLNSISSTLLVKAAKIESNLSQITTIEEKNSKKDMKMCYKYPHLHFLVIIVHRDDKKKFTLFRRKPNNLVMKIKFQ